MPEVVDCGGARSPFGIVFIVFIVFVVLRVTLGWQGIRTHRPSASGLRTSMPTALIGSPKTS